MFMNAAASKMLGWSKHELRGEVMHDAIHFQRADGSSLPADRCDLLRAAVENRAIRVADPSEPATHPPSDVFRAGSLLRFTVFGGGGLANLLEAARQ
jgi:hypothetical protein